MYYSLRAYLYNLDVCIKCGRMFWHPVYRSDNFIVGLTNVHPLISTPTLWGYTLCGQYPGAVPAGATVSLYCQDNLPPFRYLIVQFPSTRDGYFNFCELEVIAPGNSLLVQYKSVLPVSLANHTAIHIVSSRPPDVCRKALISYR